MSRISFIKGEKLPERHGHKKGDRDTARDIIECPKCGEVMQIKRHGNTQFACSCCGWEGSMIQHTDGTKETDMKAEAVDPKVEYGYVSLKAAVSDRYGVECDVTRNPSMGFARDGSYTIRFSLGNKTASLKEKMKNGMTEAIEVEVSDKKTNPPGFKKFIEAEEWILGWLGKA